ncbi:Piso0_001785 [Millerozyma farinosa CBS 7064]|uniref:Piso0_001785 protein n=1 Tax=Pichia sorbitophila (strain ATCC MYA-4447 / BCRC 22081 / CBS 7064 / NBRC 10061 / NRRL Y-12695) TaxID=559304 RepID=G8YP33_PICSO|nr:Piso0_001785 [Millerozyma farinosa CBS 7064]
MNEDNQEDNVLLKFDISNKSSKRYRREQLARDNARTDSSSDDEEEQDVENVKAEKVDDDEDMFASLNDGDDDKSDVQNGTNNGPNLVEKLTQTTRDSFDSDGEDGHVSSKNYDSDNDEEGNNDGFSVGKEQLDYYTNIETYESIEDIHNLKNKKAPKIEEFNLRKEEEEGRFDEDGNYVENEEEENPEDAIWTGMRKEDYERARKARENRDKKILERQKRETPYSTYSTNKLIGILIETLEPSETCYEALGRLAPRHKRNRKEKMNFQDDQDRKKKITKITGVCEALMNEKAIPRIYEMSREEIMRLYKQETGDEYSLGTNVKKRKREGSDTEEEEEDGKRDENNGVHKEWEFKWNEESNINGPYTADEITYWRDTYFDENVLVRKVGEESFHPINEIF